MQNTVINTSIHGSVLKDSLGHYRFLFSLIQTIFFKFYSVSLSSSSFIIAAFTRKICPATIGLDVLKNKVLGLRNVHYMATFTGRHFSEENQHSDPHN